MVGGGFLFNACGPSTEPTPPKTLDSNPVSGEVVHLDSAQFLRANMALDTLRYRP